MDATLHEFLEGVTLGQALAIYLVGNLVASFLIGFGRGVYRAIRGEEGES